MKHLRRLVYRRQDTPADVCSLNGIKKKGGRESEKKKGCEQTVCPTSVVGSVTVSLPISSNIQLRKEGICKA